MCVKRRHLHLQRAARQSESELHGSHLGFFRLRNRCIVLGNEWRGQMHSPSPPPPVATSHSFDAAWSTNTCQCVRALSTENVGLTEGTEKWHQKLSPGMWHIKPMRLGQTLTFVPPRGEGRNYTSKFPAFSRFCPIILPNIFRLNLRKNKRNCHNPQQQRKVCTIVDCSLILLYCFFHLLINTQQCNWKCSPDKVKQRLFKNPPIICKHASLNPEHKRSRPITGMTWQDIKLSSLSSTF